MADGGQVSSRKDFRKTFTLSVARPQSPLWSFLRGVAWVLMGVAVVPTKADPDLWGNLRFGLDTLSALRVTTVDPYSFTQDIPWMNHEWLSQAMMAVAYQIGRAHV